MQADILYSTRVLLAGIACALLLGCASAPPDIVTVPEPYPVYCEPPARSRPALPLDALPLDADLFEVTRAAKATVELLEGYLERLEADVNACRAKVP